MKTPPKVPSKPEALLLQTGRERKRAQFFTVLLGLMFAGPLLIILTSDTFGSYVPIVAALFMGGFAISVFMILYYLYLYITTKASDEKTSEAIKYEREMEQYQLKLEEYNEELKKESPFYVGDGSTGSEMKNTCKRCNKIWYLDAEELQFLEKNLQTSTKLQLTSSGISLLTAFANPMLSAQMQAGNMALARPLQRMQEELNEKSRCPECNSRSIERTLVGEDEKTVHKKAIIKREKSGPSKMQELEKLSEMKKEGLIDAAEFKQMKKEILGK